MGGLKAATGKGPLMSDRPNIVLVHGAWADGSSWSAVVERLQADGYRSASCWRRLPRGRHWGIDCDQTIPPDAERQSAARMGATTVEVSTNHVAMVSHPDEVAQLIETAAEAVQAAN